MPNIQIEQDNPKLIRQVNIQIERILESVLTEQYLHGYLAALWEQDLLSDEQWLRLSAEVRAAAKV